MMNEKNSNKQTGSAQYAQWAEQQLLDYENRCPGSLFEKGLSLSVEEGYRLQHAVARLRIERGDRIIGYKVGCTSATIRSQLGIDHCVTGRLYHSEQHATGECLQLENYARLAIEGELAVILERAPRQTDFTRPDVPPCVSFIMPVIELHNHVMHSRPASAGELIAHNAIHAGFVTGDLTKRIDGIERGTLSIRMDGRTVETCTGSQIIETIRTSLQWLQATLEKRGEQLQTGQIILTGSIPSLIPISQHCTIQVDAPPFGQTNATFIN